MMCEDSDLLFFEVIFKIDQKFFCFIFGEENVYFMFFWYLYIVVGPHYSEMSIQFGVIFLDSFLESFDIGD